MTIKNIVMQKLSPDIVLDTPSKRGNPFRVKEVTGHSVTIGAGKKQNKQVHLKWEQFDLAVTLVKKRGSVLIGSSVGTPEANSLRHEFCHKNWERNNANYISSILVEVGIFKFSGDRIIHVQM